MVGMRWVWFGLVGGCGREGWVWFGLVGGCGQEGVGVVGLVSGSVWFGLVGGIWPSYIRPEAGEWWWLCGADCGCCP